MLKIIILVFSLFGLVRVCVGQIVQNGQCDPSVELAQGFDIQTFLGNWFEVYRSDSPNQGGDCSLFEFTASSSSNQYDALYSSVNSNFFEEARGTLSQDGNTPRLTLSISTFPNPMDFWVLRANNAAFSVTYSCENISPIQRRVHIWVLGRERQITGAMQLQLINTALSSTFGLDLSDLRPIDHSTEACHILPEIPPGDPIIFPGQCDPNLPVVQNFDVDKFSGVWHEISRYQTDNTNGACVRAEYSRGDGDNINVLNSEVIDEKLFTIDGHATVSSNDNSARLSVVLNIPGQSPTPRDLWILVSDYESYAIAYTCENINANQRRVYSWIFSRSRRLTPTAQTAVDQGVNSYLDLNYLYYEDTDQSDLGCFFYPEPVPNEPVVFRGQCESISVRAMQEFDLNAYMGVWYNIELYPSRYQDGTCSNAIYDLVDGRVDVVNSQVNNQRLETINGVAIPASTDGSAKFEVTFPVAETDQTISSAYWVLDTDYRNYALVYTCANLNEDEMQVGSWKLSRTKQLTQPSQDAIDLIINRVSVLDQRYYEDADQSADGCFYFPEPQEDRPVVFPGQCDENVAVVQNFNFEQFQGEWYEVEAYPNAEQSGHCINHIYSVVDNTRLDLEHSSISDQLREVTNGLVRRSSPTDNSGKLIISVTDPNGQVRDIPFWILDVNYGDYAFAYGCENDGDYRRVWSWKLSRTKQLSNSANTAINNVISSNIVLASQYFRTIDQSDDACFYLPDIERGEPVILPGQCDIMITGVPDFNIAQYAGRWRLIESYGADFQRGTCNVARYTHTGDTLNVIHSQVVNEQLDSLAGTATVASTDGSGKLIFHFPSRDESFEFTVLDTDYTSYALGYGCVNLEANRRRVYSWKMSRENTLSQEAINKINAKIYSIQVLNNRFYYQVDRSDNGCFYFPIPDQSTTVRFRGQCNQNIPVVTNFNPQAYEGTWYDIESYPGDFQDGTCNTATYAVGTGNVLHVLNTQVVNQALESIAGTAVLEPSTDGSAKLKVTFNIAGQDVTADYWVIATNYRSYSLVYSCREIDDEYVQVTSWKLGRSKTFTSEEENAIATAMSNIRVLDQRYFIQRDQSPEGCFYFPEPQPGVPVVFPGQCDDTIAAEAGFDMARFQGTWHEIDAYPKYSQPGQCIKHEYALSGANTLDLESSNVFDLTLSVTNSNVRLASSDGSGRLIISTPSSDGSNNEKPYWILRTDYEDYALAYRCTNINEYFREVFSWKLSKKKELSELANTAINNAMANINILDNKYFEKIDQSDQACFHLPDITPGDDVILPGQCDTTIRGIPNFNIQQFSGQWRLVESYGAPYQTGTCNVAHYSLRPDNTLDVNNTQVVNEQLVTDSGTASVSSSDGSGLLRFHIHNQEYEIYILGTDYNSYALAYGCTNIGNSQRRVTSWKLSRFNTLSPSATSNINAIIDRIEVLHQPYYYHVDRSPHSCFYFPEPDRNTPVRFRGQCDESIQVVSDFDVEKYLNLWHDIESYPTEFQNGECPNAFYDRTTDSNTISVFNTEVVDQTLHSINGVATVASTDGSAKLKVTFPVGNNEVTSDYWVLATDYESYAFVYSCRNIDDDYMSVASWKLSRSKTLEPHAEAAINERMSTIRALDQRYFINRDQSPVGCFYFPDPQPGVPVVFPGQCDDTIAAVPNFDFNDFDGTWHEIEAYPKADRNGQCFSQQFTVNGANSMRLDAFSVLNQVETSTEGQITFASNTDTSGKLTINFGGGVSMPYWILSTDYSDYALAYSCVNINRDYRRVWSWKLSRTRQLSPAGNVAINNAIANIVVLRNDYYQDIQQTDSACFHLPEIPPGDNVILPGQCDSTIRGIPDFNIAQFGGQWRLIESYGAPYQTGTCNVAHYSLRADNTLDVTNTQVVNEQLVTDSGTVSVSSSDGSGQLRFHIHNQEYEIYILGTDYNSYALAYGCTNIGNSQRRVTSWKLSRFNTLSPSATSNINAIIDRIEVLHQPYYYHVDRSPHSCFYFPEPDRNTPVRFRGQCDESIHVVSDFDVEKYLNLWHDIESYPTEFQNGECPNAFYDRTTDSNTISVYNTEVVDQTLHSINGVATVASTDGSAKLKVTFPVGNNEVTSDYWVLATDYESYAFVYSCRNINDDYMSVASWKLSRSKTLEPHAEAAINERMSTIRALDQRYFINRDQSPVGCFYFPDPQPGVPVVFPGQCDDTIAAVPNFDFNDFDGTWHEIEAYPKADRNGQCFSQQFTVNGANSMRLDAFSVLNQVETSTEGQVTFTSNTDTSGKLTINFGGGVSMPYWILSTDYSDYALAYSCVNINRDYRRVWSWKLSRSRQLSPAGNAAINNAIANIVVLRNDYYQDIQQTDRACFHLPEIPPGDNVILPGQCDSTIRGIPDFNIAQFGGQWRLIESYGAPYQTGTCNVAIYSLRADNTLDVTNTQVVNEQLVTDSGTASVSSSDGSGQLRFHIHNQEYEIYILGTDYNSYALAYGCTNIGNSQRRVTSWKLSRFNTLSPSATSNINAIIDRIEVLHQPYYYHVDRSPHSCFYFPEPDRNTPVRFRGQCDESIQVVSDFDVEKYLNLWHDIESYPTEFQNGECPNAFYDRTTDSNTISVFNTEVVDQTLHSINGVATVASTDGSAKLKVTFPVGNNEVTSDYWVLATDYESYAFVYSCRNIDDDYMSVASWKLSRSKTLEPHAEAAINERMSTIRALDQRYFINRDQSPVGCFYFPDPQPGVPVVFPGQCDDTIAAVPNFDINDFDGTWHEIEAYPKADRNGQCFSQQFIVNGANSMRLDAISVLNQAETSTEGQVTFASNTDNSGKLTINFGEGVSMPYWILSTDYSDYALAYSCVNINRDYRRVWSWKLSRTRQLSPAGNAAINNAIANIVVLRNDYYQEIQQTDSACFHLPDLGPNEPVILPGQCDPDIPVIQNFDVTRYLGRWRLIESYYSDYQQGTCNAATYLSAIDGSVIVLNTQVIDEQLDSITGLAVPASNDGSGKLLVTFPGSSTPAEYWILDTDYSSYSLVYSCVNLPNNERRVWSWKMSRSNTLPPFATAAINQIINNINVLEARYYQSIDRTVTGCFYYPMPDRNSNVVFPGQCDESIPAVENFNINLYEGKWYDVESYPSNLQSGTCNTATYVPNSDGTLSVENTQVIDQLLDTVTGTAVRTATDGSAKFVMTLTSSSGTVITTNYWVLATDYETYSLVYSCRNIDDEFRAVYSWKLGRTPSLLEGAVTAIDNAMQNVQVLEQNYFVERYHTEVACFYYPDNQGGDVIMSGRCVADADVPAITNFNANAFAGTWHEVARFPSALQNGECSTTEFTVAGNGFDVVLTNVIDEDLKSTTTQATVPANGRGVIIFNINGVPFNNVYILATDNIEYALVYSCRNLDSNRKQLYSWKLSRSRDGLSDAANNIIDGLVTNNIDLFEPYYRYTSQDNTACFYYPVFEQLPSSIVLPGYCDTSITGVPNFNADNFRGIWNEIARYPQQDLNGQCNRVDYTVDSNGVMSVVASEVLDEAITFITGQASIASDDGSGLLNINFEIDSDNRPSNYYVLGTDYASYALVYSCTNLPNGNRRVGSWKLSRTRELSDEANEAIDDIISATQGLREEYYQTTSHTADSCFHYPTQTGSHVILPGQCDEEIPVAQIQNLADLSGIWYQVQRYDAIYDRSCISTRLRFNENSGEFIVNSVEVFNEQPYHREGSGERIGTDGSGQFLIKMPLREEDSERIERTISILAIDPEEYAIAYSCQNINTYRQVSVWQLSRQKTMPPAGVTAIEELAERRQEIHLPYFNVVPQQDTCPDPNSALLFKSSIIVILICSVFQLVR